MCWGRIEDFFLPSQLSPGGKSSTASFTTGKSGYADSSRASEHGVFLPINGPPAQLPIYSHRPVREQTGAMKRKKGMPSSGMGHALFNSLRANAAGAAGTENGCAAPGQGAAGFVIWIEPPFSCDGVSTLHPLCP